MYADIIVDISHENLDRVYQYRIPEHLSALVFIGVQVYIPFGMSNRKIKGYVIGLSKTTDYDENKIKEIHSVVDKSLAIENKLIALAGFIRQNFGGTMNDALKVVMPIKSSIKAVEKKFTKHSFDVVVSNPPYMINEHGKQNPTEAKSIARHEVLCNLEDIISAVDYLLKPFGKFFMIHKAFRLPEIFNSMINHKIEPKRMQMILPFVDKEANLVLIEGRKNGNPRLQIEENLIVYEKPGIYTEKINQIYSSFV